MQRLFYAFRASSRVQAQNQGVTHSRAFHVIAWHARTDGSFPAKAVQLGRAVTPRTVD